MVAMAIEKRVAIPDGIQVSVEGRKVKVKGPKGSLERDFEDPRYDKAISIAAGGKEFVAKSESDERKIKAVVGTFAAHVKNMIAGVSRGWKYRMKVHYTHFPITLEAKGSAVVVKNLLGEKSIRRVELPPGVKIEVKKDEVFLTGIDKEAVSQGAAKIEIAARLPKKDRRVFLDGVYMTGHEFAE